MFINYKKLARELFKEYIELERINAVISEKIADHILKSIDPKEYLDTAYIRNHYGYITTPMKEYVAEKIANKLVEDLYELKKAQVLKEMSKKDLTTIVSEKFEKAAKEHLEKFIKE